MTRKLLLTSVFLLVSFLAFAQRSVIYTTTADGTQKLQKVEKPTQTFTTSGNVINLLPDKINQSIDGFGYAITYSSCYNLLKMPKTLRTSLLKKTFSQVGGVWCQLCAHLHRMQ